MQIKERLFVNPRGRFALGFWVAAVLVCVGAIGSMIGKRSCTRSIASNAAWKSQAGWKTWMLFTRRLSRC